MYYWGLLLLMMLKIETFSGRALKHPIRQWKILVLKPIRELKNVMKTVR